MDKQDSFAIRHGRLPEGLKAATWRMRDNPTFTEKTLWEKIRLKRLGGLRFRQQHIIGPYIADFYCHKLKLVVEVDGSSHDGRKKEDQIRDEYMRSLGITVLRFTNQQVLYDIEEVKRTIRSVCFGKSDAPSGG